MPLRLAQEIGSKPDEPDAMTDVPDWYFRQSAAVPYRIVSGGLELLLITARGGNRWIFPKGVIDPHLDAIGAALQEAYEEAGVRGEVRESPLGSFKYEKWGGTCHVTVFALKVTQELDDWPECKVRSRRWVCSDDAELLVDKVFHPFVGHLIKTLG